MPPAGRHAPDLVLGVDEQRAQQTMPVGPVHQADPEFFARTKMQGNIAAIIDIGAIELRGLAHGAENLLRHGSRHRRHRGNETIGGKRRHRRVHAPRDDA